MNGSTRRIIGLRLQDIRAQRNLSIRELANLAALSESVVRRMERGHSLSLENVMLAVSALDVSMDYIIMGIHPSESKWDLTFHSDIELECLFQSCGEARGQMKR